MKKKLISIVILMCCCFFTVSCRDRYAGNGYYWGHGFGMGYGSGCFDNRNLFMSDLGLSKEQSEKIGDIDLKYRRLYFDNRGDYEKIDSLRKEHKKEIESVLDEKQKQKYNSIYSNRWRGWGPKFRRRFMGDYYGQGYGMGYGSGCYNNADAMAGDIGLSAEQVKKIEAIDLKYRDMYFKNRGDYQKIESLRREHRREIENVLTPAQRKKYSDVYDYRWRGWGPGGMMGPGMMGF